MKLATKTDYACRAVELMARNYTRQGIVHVEELARVQGMPESYLAQILMGLKGSGIVKSKRGKEGGYCLARPPEEITVGEVIRAIQGEILEIPSIQDPNCPDQLKAIWLRIKQSAEAAADGVTFEEIVEASYLDRQLYDI